MGKGGRPRIFNSKIEDKILERLENGESARSICLDEDMPCWSTLCKHLRENLEFSNQYARAKQYGIEHRLDEAYTRALDESRDVIEDVVHKENEDGSITEFVKKKSDNTAVQRDKLIIDLIKWEASRLHSKKYGDKIQQEVSGPEGKDLIPVINIKIEK